MGTGSGKEKSRPSHKNPTKKPKHLGPRRPKTKSKNKKTNLDVVENRQICTDSGENGIGTAPISDNNVPQPSAAEQLGFFLDQFQSANGIQLSSLELESIKDTCILELPQGAILDVGVLGKSIKAAFGSSWKEELCEGQLIEGEIDPGSPAVVIISISALKSLELLRGFRSLTRECHAVKLFSKHMKIEEQVSLLKNRVNIASGTPSRIKKLIDMEVLGLSRLSVIMLDIRPDVKGYSLFTLPQVRDELWDLYKNYLHQRVVNGDLRICLFGPLPPQNLTGKKR